MNFIGCTRGVRATDVDLGKIYYFLGWEKAIKNLFQEPGYYQGPLFMGTIDQLLLKPVTPMVHYVGFLPCL